MNRLISTLLRHWKPVLGLNALILAIAVHNAQQVEDAWNAKAKLILPNTTTELNADLGKLGDLTGGEGLVFSQLIDSREILASIITSDDSIRRVWEADPERDLYPRMVTYRGLFDVNPSRTSTVISLAAEGSTPELAQRRLAALISSFQQRLNELRQDDVVQRMNFFQKDLEQAERNLLVAQRNLTSFKEASNLVDSESQTTELVRSLRTLSTSQGELLGQYAGSRARVQMLSARLGQTPDQAVRALRLGESESYQSVLEKLSAVNVALVEAQAQFTDEHPQVQYLLTQRNELLRQQSNFISQAAANVPGINVTAGENTAELIEQLILAESETQALRQRVEQLQGQVRGLSAELRSLPVAQARLIELERRYEIAEGVYNGMVAQMQAAKLDAFSTYPSVQILDRPSVDTKPIGPGRTPIALGAILASIFGSTAILLFLESRNPMLGTKDLENARLPVLAGISRLKQQDGRSEMQHEADAEFQRLASSVSMLPLEKRYLLISSAVAGEGKTTIVSGLAFALTALGFRVLVVDGDFQKGELGRRLGYTSIDPSLNASPVNVAPNLDLLTFAEVGRIGEFIARGGFERSLKTVKEAGNYDYILIDSAPIGLSSETALMLNTAPDVLLVVSPGTTHLAPFRVSMEQLTRHKAIVHGLVMNRVMTSFQPYLQIPSHIGV